MDSSLSLVINAGGQSRRMGRNKALLPVPRHHGSDKEGYHTGHHTEHHTEQHTNSDEQPLIAHLINRLAAVPMERLIVVSNDQVVRDAVLTQQGMVPNIDVVADSYPGVGALGGLATGLSECPEWAIMVACDMPLIDPALLMWQWKQIDYAAHLIDAVVPLIEGREQPFHAIYHRRCLPAINARIESGHRRVNSFLPDVKTLYIDENAIRQQDPQLHSFRNVNTPEEWADVQPLLSPSV